VKRRWLVPVLRLFGVAPMRLRHSIIGWSSPPFRVGTVGLIADEAGRVLLVRHSYRPGWGFPGGMLGWRERPADTVVREMREECGLAVRTADSPLALVARDPRRVLLVYRLEVCRNAEAGQARPSSPEILEVGWFDPADMPPLSRPAARLLGILRERGLMTPAVPSSDPGV